MPGAEMEKSKVFLALRFVFASGVAVAAILPFVLAPDGTGAGTPLLLTLRWIRMALLVLFSIFIIAGGFRSPSPGSESGGEGSRGI